MIQFIRFRILSAACVALSLVFAASTSRADDAVAIDARGPSGPNPYLFTSGLVTTGLSYSPALLVAMHSERAEDKYLYAPMVDPWLDLANRDKQGDDTFSRTLLVVDGVAQAIVGLQLAAGSGEAAAPNETFQAHVVPARINNGYGLLAVGVF